MGKRKGSKKRRRPEDEATSQARRRARTPISQWSQLEEQPGPEQEEAGPSRLPVIQIPQVPGWADEEEDKGPTLEEREQALQASLERRRAREGVEGPSREQVEFASRLSGAMRRARGEEGIEDTAAVEDQPRQRVPGGRLVNGEYVLYSDGEGDFVLPGGGEESALRSVGQAELTVEAQIAQALESARADRAAYRELRVVARAENEAYRAQLPPTDESRWPAVSDSVDNRCCCNHRRWINRDSYVLGATPEMGVFRCEQVIEPSLLALGYRLCRRCAVPEGINMTRAVDIVTAAWEKLEDREITFHPLPPPHFQTMCAYMKKMLVYWGLAHCRCSCSSCDSIVSPHRDHTFGFPWHDTDMYAEVLVMQLQSWLSRGRDVYVVNTQPMWSLWRGNRRKIMRFRGVEYLMDSDE